MYLKFVASGDLGDSLYYCSFQGFKFYDSNNNIISGLTSENNLVSQTYNARTASVNTNSWFVPPNKTGSPYITSGTSASTATVILNIPTLYIKKIDFYSYGNNGGAKYINIYYSTDNVNYTLSETITFTAINQIISTTKVIPPYKTKFLLHDGDNVIKYQPKTEITYTSNLIPTMTSNTAPSGIASASNVFSTSYNASCAFDSSTAPSSGWVTSSGITTGWLAYEFVSNTKINKYVIKNNSNYMTAMPKNWTFEGSNDGTTWTVLDTQNNITSWVANDIKEFTFNNNIAYKKYRINITTNNGDTNVAISELQMMGILTSQQLENYNIVNTYPPTENDFLINGMDDISSLYQQGDKSINETVSNGETLGNGKIHKYHVKKSDMWSITGFECKDS